MASLNGEKGRGRGVVRLGGSRAQGRRIGAVDVRKGRGGSEKTSKSQNREGGRTGGGDRGGN